MLEHVDGGVLSAASYMRRDVPEPHDPDVEHDREGRVGDRPQRALEVEHLRGAIGPQQHLASARAISRIGAKSSSSTCWTMCMTNDLVGERVDRRDQRDAEAQHAAQPRQQPPDAPRRACCRWRARGASAARSRSRATSTMTIGPGARENEVSAAVASTVAIVSLPDRHGRGA